MISPLQDASSSETASHRQDLQTRSSYVTRSTPAHRRRAGGISSCLWSAGTLTSAATWVTKLSLPQTSLIDTGVNVRTCTLGKGGVFW